MKILSKSLLIVFASCFVGSWGQAAKFDFTEADKLVASDNEKDQRAGMSKYRELVKTAGFIEDENNVKRTVDAALQVWKKADKSEVKEVSLSLLYRLLLNFTSTLPVWFYEEFFERALGILEKSGDIKINNRFLDILENLVRKSYFFQKKKESSKKELYDKTFSFISEMIKNKIEDNAKTKVLEILKKLIEYKYENENLYVISKGFAQKLLSDVKNIGKDVKRFLLPLCQVLVENGEFYSDAKDAANNFLKDEDEFVRNRAIKVFQELVKKDKKYYEEGKIAAMGLLNDEDIFVLRDVIMIFHELAKDDTYKDVSTTMEAVQALYKKEDDSIQKWSLWTLGYLIGKGFDSKIREMADYLSKNGVGDCVKKQAKKLQASIDLQKAKTALDIKKAQEAFEKASKVEEGAKQEAKDAAKKQQEMFQKKIIEKAREQFGDDREKCGKSFKNFGIAFSRVKQRKTEREKFEEIEKAKKTLENNVIGMMLSSKTLVSILRNVKGDTQGLRNEISTWQKETVKKLGEELTRKLDIEEKTKDKKLLQGALDLKREEVKELKRALETLKMDDEAKKEIGIEIWQQQVEELEEKVKKLPEKPEVKPEETAKASKERSKTKDVDLSGKVEKLTKSLGEFVGTLEGLGKTLGAVKGALGKSG